MMQIQQINKQLLEILVDKYCYTSTLIALSHNDRGEETILQFISWIVGHNVQNVADFVVP